MRTGRGLGSGRVLDRGWNRMVILFVTEVGYFRAVICGLLHSLKHSMVKRFRMLYKYIYCQREFEAQSCRTFHTSSMSPMREAMPINTRHRRGDCDNSPGRYRQAHTSISNLLSPRTSGMNVSHISHNHHQQDASTRPLKQLTVRDRLTRLTHLIP